MSRKHFSLLLGLTLAVALLVLLVPGRTGKESEFEKSRLLPGLQTQVNDLDWLQFTGAGGAVFATLRRSEGAWQVEEAGGYRADWKRLRTLLAELSQAEVVEAKTANPEYYDRLGVEDVDGPDAGGIRIGFPEASGLPGVIVGKQAQGRSGQYVRLQGTAESALIDRQLELPGSATEWLEKEIVDIADSEVVEIDIVHPDGERVTARKASADDENFELQNIPEGREVRSAWTVNSLANSLSSLTLEAVAGDGTVNWSGATRFALVTADGLRVEAELVAIVPGAGTDGESDDGEAGGEAADADREFWIRLQAGLYQTAIDGAVETAEVEAAEADTAETGEAETGEAEADADGAPAEDTAAEDAETRAREINQRAGGWAYRIPQYKFDSMNKRLEDLLLAADDPDA